MMEKPLLKCDCCGAGIYEGYGVYIVDSMSYVYCGHNTDCLLKQSDRHGVYAETMEDDYDVGYCYYTTAEIGGDL